MENGAAREIVDNLISEFGYNRVARALGAHLASRAESEPYEPLSRIWETWSDTVYALANEFAAELGD